MPGDLLANVNKAAVRRETVKRIAGRLLEFLNAEVDFRTASLSNRRSEG